MKKSLLILELKERLRWIKNPNSRYLEWIQFYQVWPIVIISHSRFCFLFWLLRCFSRQVISCLLMDSAGSSKACCKCLFEIVYRFQTYVASVLIWMLHMLHTYMSQEYVRMFQLFQSYIAICVLCYKLQVFYLDVAYVSHICFKCMFQMFYLF
jgi:hypothetical protein